MRIQEMQREAVSCRQQAAEFQDRPEGPFLLRLAWLFDELASSRSPSAPESDRQVL